LRIDNVVFIICASVQAMGNLSRHCAPINPTRTAMHLFMPTAELPASRLAARAGADSVIVKGVFVEVAPPGAGAR